MTWQPIDTFNRTKMQYVLVHQDGMQRVQLWNPRGYWELNLPIGFIVPKHDGGDPTHWMELPQNPT